VLNATTDAATADLRLKALMRSSSRPATRLARRGRFNHEPAGEIGRRGEDCASRAADMPREVAPTLRALRLCSAFEPPPSALDPRYRRFNPVGGMQNHVANLTRALDRRGVAQTVLTTRPPTAPHLERVGEHSRVLRLGLPVARWRQLYAAPAAVLAPWAARRADVVHAHFTVDWGLVPIAVAVARALELPLVATIHCSLRHTLEVDSSRSRAIRRRVGAVERWLEDRADAVVTLTPRLRDLLAADGIPERKLHVIPSGVDGRRFDGTPRPDPLPGVPRPRLVFSGRLEPEKDVATLLRAAARLERPAEVVLVGDGSQREPLARLARELGIAERVHFTGFLAHAELPGVLAHADVMVHPARMEELGTAVVEGLHAGLPVVAADRGGIPVEDGREGFRVATGEPAAFAAAIDRLLADPALARRLGDAGRERARREHDWDALGGRMLDLYAALAARG
jgi:glycogen synthase